MTLDRFVAAGASWRDLARGFDIGGGPSSGWGRGCDGPFWIAEDDCLAFSDTGNHRRLAWSPDGEIAVLGGDTHRSVGATRDEKGRIVSCEWATGRVTRVERDGLPTVIAESFEGRRLNRPDDVVVRTDGNVYFTDIRDPFTDSREPFAVPQDTSVPTSGVYRVPPDLIAVELVADDLEEPGGLVLSPDERRLYVSDPGRRQIHAFVVRSDGSVEASSRSVLAEIPAGDGAPYGLTVDSEGHIYCGGPGGIWILDPTGAHQGTIPHPASRTTNLAFGGHDGQTLFFTTWVGLGCIETRRRGVPLRAPLAHRVALRRRPLSSDRRIDRHRPELDRLITPGTDVELIASGGVRDDLGGGRTYRYARTLEGPVWVADRQHLVFSDIGNDRRLRWSATDGLSVLHQPTNHANGATLDREGRIVACEHSTRRVTRRERDGSVTVVADRLEDKRLNRPNDVVIRSDGSIYFTDPWWDFGSGEAREVDFNGVYLVSPDLATLTPLVRDFVLPNGLCFSPDERTLYIDDTRRRHVRAFDVLPDGTLDLGSDRVFAELGGDAPGAPDGMKVDVEGNVYCGGPGGLWIISPGAVHLGTIVHGGKQTNNLAFGGPDWKTLFFVSSISIGCVRVNVPGVPVPSVGPVT